MATAFQAVILRGRLSFPSGHLGQDDGDEHQSAADELASAEAFVEKHPAADDGESRFHAHDDGGNRRVEILLP